jgi:hypothetical protein
MNIFLQDPNIIRVPPEEVRLKKVKITPQMDGSRIKLQLELTPFLKRPNISVTITTPSGEQMAHSDILETMLSELELTMHLRQAKPAGEFTAEISVYYQKLPLPSDSPVEVPLPDPMIVDSLTKTFSFQQLET